MAENAVTYFARNSDMTKAGIAQCHLVNDRIIELGTAEYADPSFSL